MARKHCFVLKCAIIKNVKRSQREQICANMAKNLKIQNGHHFWGGEIFLKIANNTKVVGGNSFNLLSNTYIAKNINISMS